MISSQQLAEILEHVYKTTENPFNRVDGFWNKFLGLPPVLHRDYLTRIRINMYEEPIPRIEVIKNNLRRLGNIRLNPERLR